MEEYKIFFKKSVEKDFKKIPRNYLVKILERIEYLKFNPRAEGSEKLTGQELYRVRQGSYRIVYSIQDNELTACLVNHVFVSWSLTMCILVKKNHDILMCYLDKVEINPCASAREMYSS